jgi:hypothetical protein
MEYATNLHKQVCWSGQIDASHLHRTKPTQSFYPKCMLCDGRNRHSRFIRSVCFVTDETDTVVLSEVYAL